ncbi:MAG: hypothetical protein CVT59_09280 [Actinobacteria bacterium HGW-Actinobacteria-1]|jgi:hypothetical protein|nr:MAG: hypothetical protein CVT59_09280 [Actinobacteria bacterium HGW-Actinobacteria-1]
MYATLIAAVAVMVVSSAALMAVGTAYKWQVASRGYGLWTRAIGVLTVLALTGITVWSRRADTLVAVLAGVGGLLLAGGYVWLHVRLTNNLRNAGVESSL